jgi:hypothetical protein
MDNEPKILTPPPEYTKLIELLCDNNLSMIDIDARMGWAEGETARKIRRYPLLAKTATEARALAMREAGLSKVESFKVIASAHGASTADERPDHEVRLKAADRALALMGEKTVGGGPTVAIKDININITNPEDIARLEKITQAMDEITQRMNLKKKTIDVVAS